MNAETVNVELGERRYPIHIGHNLADALLEFLQKYVDAGRPIAVVTCPTLPEKHAKLFERLSSVARITIATSVDGETAKNVKELVEIWETLARERIDRSGAIVAVGGGVVGDLAGFAAASFLRGIDFIQVPTTLLSMVDSSVGGKTGLNLSAGKNLVGAFYQPQAVFADMRLLSTLPPREFSAGMAEVIKYGLLGDARLFETLENAGTLAWDSPKLPDIVKRCCEIKAQVVASDERETAQENGRALLNLGHTFGHAIEKVAGYGEYLHGEAVAVGTVAAALLSEQLGYAPAGTLAPRCIALLKKNALPVRLHSRLPVEMLMRAMASDKKVRAGKLRFVLMRAVGEAFTTGDVPADAAESVWEALSA